MDERPSIVRTVAEHGEEFGWPPEFIRAARAALENDDDDLPPDAHYYNIHGERVEL